MTAELSALLREIVGEENISVNGVEKIAYSHDIAPIPSFMAKLFRMEPDYVVRPESIEEIAEVVRLANKYRVPIVPRGSATWGYGGAVPVVGGIVLDLTGLNRIGELRDGVIEVEAGVVWKSLMERLEGTEWMLPCYPSSALSSTVGGWAATGGLGYGSLKYSSFAENVQWAKVVLPTGEIKRISADSAEEPTLKQLFGSEGTLCIFGEIGVKLVERGEVEEPFIAYFNRTLNCIKAANKLLSKTRPFTLVVKSSAFLKAGEPEEVESGAIMYGLFEGEKGEVKQSMEIFRKIIEESGGIQGDREAARDEWEDRFYPLKIKKWAPTVITSDVLLPIDTLEGFVRYAWTLGRKLRVDVDLEIMYVSPDQAVSFPLFLTDERKFSYMVHLTVAKKLIDYAIKNGGRSYGYGLWNSIHLARSEPRRKRELERLKRMLDPNNVLNPGKTVKMSSRLGFSLPRPLYSMFMEMLWVMRGVAR